MELETDIRPCATEMIAGRTKIFGGDLAANPVRSEAAVLILALLAIRSEADEFVKFHMIKTLPPASTSKGTTA